MIKKLLAAGAVATLLFTAAGCGGLSDDEQKVADEMTKSLSESQGSGLEKKDAKCVSEKFIGGVGLDDLKKQKLVTKKNKLNKKSKGEFNKKTAETYANSYFDCVDYAAAQAKLVKDFDKNADEKKLKKCIDSDVKEGTAKKALVDSLLGKEDSKDAKKVGEAVNKCMKDAGVKLG